MTRERIPLATRLLAKTDRLYGDPPERNPALGPCWPWMGARNAEGYGVIRADKQPDGRQPLILAHRAALALALGRPILRGMDAAHACDVTYCVRPSHLRELSHRENELEKERYRTAPPIYGRELAS